MGGMPLAAASGVKPSAVKKIMGGSMAAQQAMHMGEVEAGMRSAVSSHRLHDWVWKNVHKREQLNRDFSRDMPANIANMKSWSPVFKVHCAIEDTLEAEAMAEALTKNKELRDEVCRVLGVPSFE